MRNFIIAMCKIFVANWRLRSRTVQGAAEFIEMRFTWKIIKYFYFFQLLLVPSIVKIFVHLQTIS